MFRYFVSFVFQPRCADKHRHGNRVVERDALLCDEAGLREVEARINDENDFMFDEHAIVITNFILL